VACDGSTRANACGGCTALPLLGDACGPCLLDEYVCDGAETVECDGATPPSNGCGGCSPLPLLGQPCGPCSLDEYICNGASSVACDGATPCPLGALGEACTIDSDCASGACSEESDDADARRCVPRLFGSTPTQLDFSYVPPGSFAMGTPEDEIGALDTDESPVSVTFSRHLAVSRTEITQGQWMRAAGATNPSRFVACGDACPVEMLDWFAAAAYANWLSNNDGDLQTSPCYTFTPTTCADSQLDWADGDTDCTGATFAGLSCTGYRLLSDAEWEYAARAGTTTATYWNPSTSEPTGGILQSPFGCDPQPALEPIAWYCENAAVTTHEVSLLLANAWGLYDMLGNVNEWTTDWNVTPLPGGLDPLNPAGSGTRLMRGGSWFATARGLRVSWRYAFAPTSRVDDLGFRVARSLPTPPRSVALGERCAADVDCESGACSEESAGTENDRCVPRFFDGESAQMDLSYVPAGTFVMGSPATEPARGTGVLDETQVSVTITRPFAMTNTEITEGQWLQATGSTNPTAWPICGETCPINSIDWYAAAAYANWLNDNDGDPATTSCYSFTPTTCADAIVDWGDGDTDCTGASFAGVACTGYRLPTEAEWEFAARAGTTAATYWNGATSAPTGGGVVFPYGCDPQPNIEPIAWYCENTSRVQPSAELQPNAWGLHDMLGNVWEWTNDGTSGPPPGGIDPVGGGPTGNRMMRGSSYSGRADSLRSAYRNALAPSSRNLAVGFRLVRVLP
jgi:formylglycine-generating enzyme required for sulfatase activity